MIDSNEQSRDEGAKPGELSGEARGDAASLVGRVISERYQVIECLATGGMSSVYRGEHIHMRKSVAIKVLDPKAERLPELVLRFQREAIAGAHVQHPNIAATTDFGQLEDGSYFLVLEYVPGVTLKTIIARGPVAPARAVAIARQVASALKSAHDIGILHRDVKPANVMVIESQHDAVKLIDFGLAQVDVDQVPTIAAPPPGRADQPAQALTVAGMVFGTVAYMAPEAALGMGAVDARSDLYALGMTLYEMLAGRHPFDDSEPVRLFLQQRTVVPPAIGARSPEVEIPAPVEAIVAKLLEKDPKERPQSAGALIDALDAAMLRIAFDGLGPMHPPALGDVSAGDEAATVVRPWGAAVEAAAVELRAAPEAAQSKEQPLPAFPMPMTVEMAAFKPIPPVPPPQEEPAPWRVWLTKEHLVHRLGALRKGEPFPPWVPGALGAAFLVLIQVFVLVFRAPVAIRAEATAAAPGESGEPLVPPVASAGGEVLLEIDGLDAAAWRTTLRGAARAKEWDKAIAAVMALLRLDPGAFREHEMEVAWRTVAPAVDQEGGERADKMFDELTNDHGTAGLDLLYDVARWRSGTKASKRAMDILRRPEVTARVTPALEVLLDLRQASCSGKRAMFGRVGEEGDPRALRELVMLRDAECNRWRDPCCFNENAALLSAIRSLKAKQAPQH